MNILRLVCCMTGEAGLETVLSAAFSLKHETDMMKTFSSSEEAFDKAKEMGLTREQAAKCIHETPRRRFAFYDQTRGEPVKPDDWKPPDFRSLIQHSSSTGDLHRLCLRTAMPRQPHPDGPTGMTMNQLAAQQNTLGASTC